MTKKLLTADAAHILRVTPKTVHLMVATGRLRCERTVSGVRLFDEGDVQQLEVKRAAHRKARGK